MMHYWDGHWGWGMGFVGWILMLLFWLAVLGLAVWLIVYLTRGQARAGPSALEILKERYARGEIDKAEYEQKRKDLLE
ncbi:SHOCT domain-containing protein [Thermithiobacillus tepidarius DSM 3134]|uniref:SHOCT domain-containing protein n=1 Tax=Thermithiobacillus tepidarius TaxID=929 RepID=UPI0003F6E5F9|nr:SHOCT domain-containing protein [Thermithiobacillus tepidarius]